MDSTNGGLDPETFWDRLLESIIKLILFFSVANAIPRNKPNQDGRPKT